MIAAAGMFRIGGGALSRVSFYEDKRQFDMREIDREHEREADLGD